MQDNSTTSNPLPTTAIFRAYKTELDPNNKQRTSFIKHCGAARFIYNWALADRIKRKAISDASFCELRRQIEYKAKWHGVEVIVADRWFASSKTCSSCGEVKHSLLLSERTFVCESCGVVIDRDRNAAVNLAQMAGKRSVTALGEASAGILWDVKLASLNWEHGTAGPVSL